MAICKHPTMNPRTLCCTDCGKTRAQVFQEIPAGLVGEFEGGHHPIDEPPGLEEKYFRLWKRFGGDVVKPDAILPGRPLNLERVAEAITSHEFLAKMSADYSSITAHVDLVRSVLIDTMNHLRECGR